VRTSVSDMAWEPRADYWQQLQYTSKELIRFIDQILLTSKKEPVIILQSDHGPWIQDKDPQNVYEARSRILNAYYVPDSIKNVLHSDVTPVNSFRILFSHLFKANYPSLPDKPFLFSELKEDITFKRYNN
ncbi:MAG: hypothetical protein J7502_15630, partial [Flavisolibacter sp.]|nr:hypothetical protein [Flavisolibacter sp.]